ncbi:MAG: HD domain-containing protein [bacterium]|jgi:hypothetical protein
MDFITHEFEIAPENLLPGMVISRDLVHRGTTWLRFNTVLNEELIERIRKLDLPRVNVYFHDSDVELFKSLLYKQDSTPSREDLESGIIALLSTGGPDWARPRSLCRDLQVAAVVEEVLGHVYEIITRSSSAFNLLLESRFFRHPHLNHCQTAAIYSVIVGVEMDFNLPALIDLGICGLFYDIGKLRVPQEILNKPGKLTQLEYAQVKKHCHFGRQMASELARNFPSLDRVALEHHENYYGGGYPRDIRGDDIHPFSQIVSLADKFAAQLTPKEYRDAYLPGKAFESVLSLTRSSVSPQVFKAFMQSVMVYPRNSFLQLSSGAIAVVVESSASRPLHPTVELVYSDTGEAFVGVRPRLNLAERPDLSVVSFFSIYIPEKRA